MTAQQRTIEDSHVWVEERGDGEPTLLLLHGLGATGEVWKGLDTVLERRWPGRRVIPDLRGHGRSSHAAAYSFGLHAADMAALVGDAERLIVVGHSMGGVVGLALASGWFGVEVSMVVALGVKVSWSEEEIERVSRRRDRRPLKWFDDRNDAAARFLRVAGLEGLIAPDSPVVDSGIVESDGRFRLAGDPSTGSVGAPSMVGLMAASRARVVLARGGRDPLVGLDELRSFDPEAIDLDGLGHNAHVEDPERVWDLVAPASEKNWR